VQIAIHINYLLQQKNKNLRA